jgi:cyclopropane-fatty-acyl-phospholipid synthase
MTNKNLTKTITSYRPSLSMRLVLGMARQLRCGTCHIVWPDGTRETLRGNLAGPEAVCKIRNDDRLAKRFLTRGILGFCESYLDGDWSSPDLVALFELAARNEAALGPLVNGKGWWRWLEQLYRTTQRNHRRGAQRNIAKHYDLGNKFYAQWLDPSMTYSAALFDQARPAENAMAGLQQAQQRKYERIAQNLGLEAAHEVLEIGCGWGGFAEYAAGTVGCKVTAITISQAQYEFARTRIAAAGLDDRVTIKLCDYRDVTGAFDRIVSIEMFEAVGESHWPNFFAKLSERLRPGGVAAMQVITILERNFLAYRRGADYIQKYIFPGGMLPTLSLLRQQVAKSGLSWREEFAFGEHYAETLAVWRERFLDRWTEISRMGFDEHFRRLWEQYLCYSEAGFRAGTIDVHQFSFIKPSIP